MEYFRLIRPSWGKKKIRKEGNLVDNPGFIHEIDGPDVLGDSAFSPEFVAEKNAEGYNVYWFPNYPSNPPKDRPFLGKDIDVFQFVFCDMDLKDGVYGTKEEFLEVLSQFKFPPSLTLDSGNGIHAYWSIQDLDRDSYLRIQLALIQKFQTDKSVWTALQIMRYPNSINTKDFNNLKPVQMIPELSSDQTYAVQDLLNNLPQLTDDNERRLKRHVDLLEGRQESEVSTEIATDELPARFLKDVERSKDLKELFYDPKRSCGGDRSKADMKLANLLWNLDYDRDEALQVLMNTQKALSRTDRTNYAFSTLDKVYSDRAKFLVKSASHAVEGLKDFKGRGKIINGPSYFDDEYKPWRTTNILGLIGGSGSGKTTVTLNIFKSLIENNPDSKDIFLFFTLEMPESEILERWMLLTGGLPQYMNRLYVVANEDENGDPRHIGLQEIYWYCRDIQKTTGCKIGSIAIDHINILSRHIDLRKDPNFKAFAGDRESMFGDIITIGQKFIVSKLKELAKKLDLFVIIQSQTTKEKDGGGDIPLGKNAAYGDSGLDWFSDYIITFWQPIKRVQDSTNIRVLGWQYAKRRHTHTADRFKVGQPYLLRYDPSTGAFSSLSSSDEETIKELISRANDLRKAEEKKQFTDYKVTPEVGRALKVIYGQKTPGGQG